MAVIFLYLTTGLIVAGFMKVAYGYWEPYAEDEAWRSRRRFFVWAAKGIVVPVVGWVFLHAGLTSRFPALFPGIAAKTISAKWAACFTGATLPTAVIFVSSCFAAVTMVWLVVDQVIETDCHRDVIVSGALWGVLLSPVVALILYTGGWFGSGLAAIVWLIPVAHELLAIKSPKRIARPYAAALAKLRAGQYAAAERKVLHALEKCEDDIQGWILLAELYGKHFNDLAEADRVIGELCRQPNITREQMADALHRLADWHLRGNDLAAARRALEKICEAMPHSEYADVARRRINRLANVRAERMPE